MKKPALLLPLIIFAACWLPLKPSDPPIVVTSDEMTAEYDQNIEAAKLKYEDKPVQITGKVYAIEDRRIWMEINFRASAASMTYVISHVLNADKEKVTRMAKGDTITLLCRGGSVWDGKPDRVIQSWECRVQN